MKNLIKQLKTMLDKNNPKYEINHIFVDQENIVLTDTRYLIVIKHDLDIKQDMLLINDKAKYEYLHQNYSDIFGSNYITKGFSYPEYKRLIRGDMDFKYSTDGDLFNSIYDIQSKYPIAINFKLFQTLNKLNKFSIYIDKFIYNEYKLPLHLKGSIIHENCSFENDFYITFMPTIIR
jgi:hypothetical protein